MIGKYIVIEGAEAVGKSTQVELLRAWLIEQGREVLHVREPGGTLVGERIRELVTQKEYRHGTLTSAYLFAAARAELLAMVIRPAVEEGKVVLADRNVLSSLAYQGHSQGLSTHTVLSINLPAMNIIQPDAILLLRLPGDVRYGRLVERARSSAYVYGTPESYEENSMDGAYFSAFRDLLGLSRWNELLHEINADGERDVVLWRVLQCLQKNGIL